MVSVPHGLSVTRPLCPQGFMPVNTATHARSMATTPRAIWLIGPALVAGIAYLDPGNVGSNMTAGSTHGFLLVWVVILGNAMAWLIQYLSAKLGIVTGQSLPEVLGGRLHRRPWLRRSYWLQAELVAMATDIAEVIGGAVAVHLLFGMPLVWGGVTAGVASILLLFVQSRYGARLFEVVIIGLIVIIAVGFTVGVFIAPPSLGSVLGGLVPRVTDTSSVLLAASILGATIMPHAIYAHSALSRDRFAPPTTAKGGEALVQGGSCANHPHRCGRRNGDCRIGEPCSLTAGRDNPQRSTGHRRAGGCVSGHRSGARTRCCNALRGRVIGVGAGLNCGGCVRGCRDHAGTFANPCSPVAAPNSDTASRAGHSRGGS